MRFKIKPLNFATRLGVVYLGLLLIPLLAITLINYQNFKEMTTSQTIDMNERSLKQSTAFLNYTLASLNNIIDALSFDETVQTLLKTGSGYDRTMEGNWFIQRTDILNIIYNPYTSNELQSVQVYPNEGPSSFSQTESFQKLDEQKRKEWNDRVDSLALFKTVLIPSSLFTDSFPHTISLVKRIADFSSINKYIGLIKGDIPQKVFQSIVGQTAALKGSTTLLFNAYDEIIAFTGDTKLAEVQLVNNLLDSHDISLDGTFHPVEVHGRSLLLGCTKIDYSDWKLVCIIDNHQVLAAAMAYRKQVTWMVLAFFLLSIPLSMYTTKTVTNRIRKLQEHIGKSKEQGFDIPPLDNGTDEIGQLTVCYDEMARDLQGLLEEQFQLGYQIKNLEFKVLQSTIDPHFLYNTLDLMSWKALQNNDEGSANLAKKLSKFYKLSLGHGQTMVPLSQELEHVQAYVEIQNMRFEGKVTLEIRVPQNLLDSTVFKIMLQPIVENAILHGIREKENEQGIIRILARVHNSMLILSVADNGVGMDEEQIKSLLTISEKNSGYGIWNIHERIRLAHGENYGIQFFSKPKRGTVVFIKLPLFPL